MKHIKSLDIVQKEIDKIMPNELSSQLDDNFDIDVVRKDLESEDVFSIAFQNIHNQEQIGNVQPDEEWLQSSVSDVYLDTADIPDMDLTGA